MVGKSKGSAQQKMAATVWFDERNSGSKRHRVYQEWKWVFESGYLDN